jgi:hypothetical protein
MRSLQEYTRLAARATDPDRREDLAWLLVLDNLVFAAEAEIRWLDHVEQRLARLAHRRPRTGPVSPLSPSGPTEGRSPAKDAEQQGARR